MAVLCFLLLAIFSSFLLIANAEPSKAAVAHVECDVCKLAMKEVRTYAKEKGVEDEDSLGDLAENLCNPEKVEGKWVKMVDIVKVAGRNSQLSLQKMSMLGACRNECRIVEQACKKVVGKKDDQIVSLLKDEAGLSKFHNSICGKPCKKRELPKLVGWVNEDFMKNMYDEM
mmetsp:Transcript_14092/g.26128  ORF Transcript_14092/g.26128 Transcript_14092/m.26128 type:complete len:171 (-) Transcript_14092:92-604(-)